MKIVCYVDPDRPGKTGDVMKDFAVGCGGEVSRNAKPVEGAQLHVVMGNWTGAQQIIPRLRKAEQRFYHIDNGWLRNGPDGLYYRVTRDGIAPSVLPHRSSERLQRFGVKIKPWRRGGKHVLVCMSSDYFGKPFGIDQQRWLAETMKVIRGSTKREIIVRRKPKRHKGVSLENDLRDAWCLVTHSSGAAVKAALMGVPVFCEPTCGAAMVGCQDYARIEQPLRPDNREQWIASLVWQQWSRQEMRSGRAWMHLRKWM